MRGDYWLTRSISSTASATSSASLAAHSQDVPHAPANPPKLCPAQTAHPSVVNSKTVGSRYCAISNTHLAPHPSPVAPENRVAHRPIPSCIALQRRRNRDNTYPPCVVAGTCMQKSDGRGELPTISFRPKWTFAADRERQSWGSSRADLTKPPGQFKSSRLLSPLTLALSPLRGEGSRDERRGEFESFRTVES